jgi:hypothetical protein
MLIYPFVGAEAETPGNVAAVATADPQFAKQWKSWRLWGTLRPLVFNVLAWHHAVAKETAPARRQLGPKFRSAGREEAGTIPI